MNVRLHWVLGTAILVTACLLPLLLWWYGLDRTAWIATLFVATVAVISLIVLLGKRVNEACEKTVQAINLGDADELAGIPDDILCPACSYDLHGAPGMKCPECGYSLLNIRSDVCRIPWVRRKELGRIRSYWLTVWMVTFRNRRFCEEYAHSLGYTEARRFQWAATRSAGRSV